MDGVSGFGPFESSFDVNMASIFEEKTLGVSFTAGADVTTRQVIYEQGGGWRGLSMYVEDGQLHMNVWSIAGDTIWGYKTVSVDIAAGEDYSAVMTMTGAADNSGMLTGYLNGDSVGEVAGVGLLRSHNNGNGVGESNGHSVFAGEVDAAANRFGGSVHTVAQYNRALDPDEADALGSAITPEPGPAPDPAPGPDPIQPPEGAVWSVDDPAYGPIPNDTAINAARIYEAKTFGVAFTAGDDIDGLQMIFEQGGGWRGASMYIEGGQLHMNVWSVDGGTIWGFKSVTVDIEAGQSYSAAMVMEGAAPANGTLTAYLDGEAVGAVDGVGLLLRHRNGIGVGETNSQTIVDGAPHTATSPFGGVIERIAQYNTALDGEGLGGLTAWLADALPQPEPGPGAAPVIEVNAGAALDEGAETVLTTDMLDASDADTADSGLTYTLTETAAHGGLYRDGVRLEAGDSFTQADLADGLIAYRHDGSETLADGFGFTLSDDQTTLTEQRFDVAIDPVNDAPVITANEGAELDESAVAVLTPAMLAAADVDTADDALVYTITESAAHGGLFRNGEVLRDGDSFTQGELNDGLISYGHDGSETLSDGFAFTLSDGEATLSEQRFDVTIDPVNDAPIITGGTAFSVAEDFQLGGTIGQILASDAEGDTLSFAIIGGNEDGLFAIDAATGELSLAGGLDYETQTAHSVEVAVSDGTDTTTTDVAIAVTDVDETPEPDPIVGKQNVVVVIDAGDREKSPDYFTVADDYDIRMGDSDANGPHTHGKAVEKSIYDIVGPESDLQVVHLKIASDSSTGASTWTMDRAFDYVIDNLIDVYDVLSVNLSYGSGASDNATTFFDDQFEILKENGTFVTIAAGNDGSSGTNVIANSVHENVFVMSASSTSGRHEGYSNEGVFTDYYAKGTTQWHRDADNTENDSGIRGTSFAAPTATGLVAKVQETAEEMFGRLLDIPEITSVFDNVEDKLTGKFTGEERSLLNFDGVMKSFSDVFDIRVAIDDSGDAHLTYQDGLYQIETESGAVLDITRGGSVFTDDMNAGWDPYQVEDNDLGGYTLVFRTEFGTEKYRQWELDETGAFLSADNSLSEGEKKAAEKTVGVDLNNDLFVETESGKVSVFADREILVAESGADGDDVGDEAPAFILASNEGESDLFDFGMASPAVIAFDEALDAELSVVWEAEEGPVADGAPMPYEQAPMPVGAEMGGFAFTPEVEELWLA